MAASLEQLNGDPGFRELFKTARQRQVARNRVIISEGAAPGHLYLIVSGLVAVRHSGSRGMELLLAYLYPGDFFGEMCLFPGVRERSAMIKANTDCTLLEIGYQDFIALSCRHQSLWLELAGQLAARLRVTNHRLAVMPALYAADRVWLVLQEMAARIGPRVSADGQCIRITRKDLGKLAGCSRELAGMVLRDFAQAGRIRLHGKTIVVPHPG